ncbi:hypothetical protein F4Y59_12005 [Candidatus Poribacteria bacterium]|nr:hypothetical protein [Candidatus Poribacteria bacterium]MYK18997.1 hypothetical protein [Candidatus Poribacteria bacterium]
MHQSSIIEYWTEQAAAQAHQQGLQQGVIENTREKILEALELRLHPEAARTFKPTLERIEDLQRLNELFRAAIQADSPEDFQQVLENGN